MAVIVHADLLTDPAEAEMVGDDEGVHPVVRLPQRTDQSVPVDGYSLQADYHIAEPHDFQRRCDFL